MTDYRPSCESNAELARLLGAHSQMAYRQALVSKGALAKARAVVNAPQPGDELLKHRTNK